MSDIPCPLAEAARNSPDITAVIDAEGSSTYAQFDANVRVLTDNLIDEGIRPGMVVGIAAENSRAYTQTLFAIFRLGAIACPLPISYPVDKVRDMIDRVECAAVITDPDYPDLGNAEFHVVDLEELAQVSPELSANDIEPCMVPPDSEATIVFTSGSGSHPKAALLSYGNHYYNALGSNANIPLAPGDRWLLSLPLYHVGGLGILFRCFLAGASIVIPGQREVTREVLSTHAITHLSVVPTQLRRLIAEKGTWPDISLKSILMGGAAPPEDLIRRARELNLPLYLSYGLTEMASQVATTQSPDAIDSSRRPASGKILPHREVKTAPDGEILVRGKTLFDGYIEDGNLVRPLDEEGWFHTGDLGEIADDGQLVVLGRRDDVFVSGGENVSPTAIENTLLSFDGIEEAVVVAVDDDEFGTRPFAFVAPAQVDSRKLSRQSRMVLDYIYLTRGRAPLPVQVKQLLKEMLPKFAVPVAIAPLPETSTDRMKPDRTKLRSIAEELRRHFPKQSPPEPPSNHRE